jgi:hypothetical protein
LTEYNWKLPVGLFGSFLHEFTRHKPEVITSKKNKVYFFKGTGFKKERVQETQNPLFNVKNG